MDLLADFDVMKIVLLAAAFTVGLAVCIYIAVKETIDLNRRRKAKRLANQPRLRPLSRRNGNGGGVAA